jgi:hypothetical protein
LGSDDGSSSNVGPTTDDYFEEGTQRYFKVKLKLKLKLKKKQITVVAENL